MPSMLTFEISVVLLSKLDSVQLLNVLFLCFFQSFVLCLVLSVCQIRILLGQLQNSVFFSNILPCPCWKYPCVKNAEAAISSCRGEAKSLSTGGIEKFQDWGRLPIWGVTFAGGGRGGVSTSLHAMSFTVSVGTFCVDCKGSVFIFP